MISYPTTSLFKSRLQTLVNPVNTVGIMGKGLALQFKRRYPAMFKRYKRFCDEGLLTVGRLDLYLAHGDHWVLNFPTKEHWKDPSRLEWIDAGLKKLAESYESKSITGLALPELGCGLGGLNWTDVRPLIERHLGDLKIPVHVHISSDEKGAAA